MPTKGKPIIIIDRYTMVQIARYPSVKEAAKDLEIPANSIYQSLCFRVPIYESYFIYEDEFLKWTPSEQVFRKVRGLKISQKLEELRNGEYE